MSDSDSQEVNPASLLTRNREWVSQRNQQQHPKILWIGCSDSRVAESIVTMSPPGVIFTQRNIANQFMVGDMNANAVLEYAVARNSENAKPKGLGIDHVVIVGHSGCGGVQAAMDEAEKTRDIDCFKGHAETSNLARWIGPLVELVKQHPEAEGDLDQMVDINVEEQMKNVRAALEKIGGFAKDVQVHGWVYDLESGLLRDLDQPEPEPRTVWE
ncbi:carbonic anhydrase [Schizopora paradoxa]|uniref:Carbonic anhydrase n=1 Tax=Schizopora paradoxa TaxID=27342 RepID=A0A0H2RX07_9AGAM|nr:carbonic anhydrase [Schizopora paradoxa]